MCIFLTLVSGIRVFYTFCVNVYFLTRVLQDEAGCYPLRYSVSFGVVYGGGSFVSPVAVVGWMLRVS